MKLSAFQILVLTKISEGKSYALIAKEENKTIRSIKQCVYTARRMTGAATTPELMAMAFRTGVLK